jgi:TonB family protein
MYFEFEDYKPDISPVGSVISWREGILLSIIVHLAGVILILMTPQIFEVNADAIRAREAAMALAQKPEPERFVFVEPSVDLKALKPPERAVPSDQDRERRSVERVKEPNPLPFSRGNTRERVEQAAPPRGQGQTPDPPAGQQAQVQPDTSPTSPQNQLPIPDAQASMQLPTNRPAPQVGANGPRPLGGGSLGDTLRNLQRYVQKDQFDNPQGGGQFGPAIQFDTKGVEFGPWIRRFIAQVKRNWNVPYAAMMSQGHVVITFNVHKDGSITDLQVVGPSSVGAFNSAAYGALATSNPTAPLPPEYPSEKAFFTVTFFYNEEPPQ